MLSHIPGSVKKHPAASIYLQINSTHCFQRGLKEIPHICYPEDQMAPREVEVVVVVEEGGSYGL